MIILGIDPGYAILGYGVLEADGRKVRPLDYGVVETKVGTPFPERLDMLYAGVNELLQLYRLAPGAAWPCWRHSREGYPFTSTRPCR